MTNNNRHKVTTACQNCQRSKIKCSGEIPCRRCSKLDKKCKPGKPGRKRGPPIGRSRNFRMESVYNNNDPQVQEVQEELRNLKNTSFVHPVTGNSSNSGYQNVDASRRENDCAIYLIDMSKGDEKNDQNSSNQPNKIQQPSINKQKQRQYRYIKPKPSNLPTGASASNSSNSYQSNVYPVMGYTSNSGDQNIDYRSPASAKTRHENDCDTYLIDMRKGDKDNEKNDRNSSSQPNKREQPPSINKQKEKQFRHIKPKHSNLPTGASTSNSSDSYQSNVYPVMGYSSNSGDQNVNCRSPASVKTRRENDCDMYLIDMSKDDKGNEKNDRNSSNQPNKREQPSINKKQFRHIMPKHSNLPTGA
ncbi:hypothetical protein C1645_882552, partial [Glomus cerebriforme]